MEDVGDTVTCHRTMKSWVPWLILGIFILGSGTTIAVAKIVQIVQTARP